MAKNPIPEASTGGAVIAYGLMALMLLYAAMGGLSDPHAPSEKVRAWDGHAAGQSFGRSLGLNDSGDGSNNDYVQGGDNQ